MSLSNGSKLGRVYTEPVEVMFEWKFETNKKTALNGFLLRTVEYNSFCYILH